ncbi:MAG: N-6 DNA methylase, partial [Anaerolineae bacterium]|nr:N-6 DNA methylase [Anaerolineae bacterium]
AEDFFRSTLVQTLFYGLFSAWVLWHEKHPGAGRFDLWRDTRRLNMPVISELFEQFSSGTVLPLSVEQILDWTTDALNRVDRAAFFATFNQGAVVQYFYEPFLEAFDPELRRQLGVWYTPPEVVEYMVARVDAALKNELGIADGLADPHVYVLDPCCGTGAYLVAVLRHIYAALQARDGDVLAAQAVQQAMRERIFGFEILPAPFVVAHLQIGMLLNTLHAPLTPGKRAGVYLTNALTGWEPPEEPKTMLMFPELQRERDAADRVKRSRPILVILGNPPYSGFAGVAVDEERALSEAYRTTQNPKLPRPQGQGLNDLYVRFYRMAERQIVENTKRGVVCFISNYSWLDGLSHPGMRERYLEAFDRITIDNLNGDKYKTGKTTPEGKPDPSIFSTEFNREGIQVGTAIATLIRKPQPDDVKSVGFRNLWGTGKRAQLRAEADHL